jgi:hypothetical protein
MRTVRNIMSNGTYLSLGQASKACGRAKSTLSKALNSGELSYVEKTQKGYKIDPAELFRVFPKGGSMETPIEQSETVREVVENSALQASLKVMEQRLADAEKTIEDLRSRLDAEREERRELAAERRQLTAVITDQRDKMQKSPEPSNRGWKSRLFG